VLGLFLCFGGSVCARIYAGAFTRGDACVCLRARSHARHPPTRNHPPHPPSLIISTTPPHPRTHPRPTLVLVQWHPMQKKQQLKHPPSTGEN